MFYPLSKYLITQKGQFRRVTASSSVISHYLYCMCWLPSATLCCLLLVRVHSPLLAHITAYLAFYCSCIRNTAVLCMGKAGVDHERGVALDKPTPHSATPSLPRPPISHTHACFICVSHPTPTSPALTLFLPRVLAALYVQGAQAVAMEGALALEKAYRNGAHSVDDLKEVCEE